MVSCGSLRLVAISALFLLGTALRAQAPANGAGVAVLHSAPWQPGDTVRDGAGEFAVFLQAAQLKRKHRAAGLIAVCDRHGNLRSGGERALRRLVLSGLAVVKLASDTAPDLAEHPAFLDGGRLAPHDASDILARCLDRYGAPPAASDPEKPTQAELDALRAHLRPFQAALNAGAGNGPKLAQR